MSTVKAKDLRGYRIGKEIVCFDCSIDPERITEEESENLTEKDCITAQEIEDKGGQWFCDRCKKRL